MMMMIFFLSKDILRICIRENKLVKETTEYKNYVEVLEKDYKPTEVATLEDFIELEQTEDKEWKKHWINMPEYSQEKNTPYKSLIVHFRNAEDYTEFQKKLDQIMTIKTKSIWYPELDKDQNSLKRWIEE